MSQINIVGLYNFENIVKEESQFVCPFCGTELVLMYPCRNTEREWLGVNINARCIKCSKMFIGKASPEFMAKLKAEIEKYYDRDVTIGEGLYSRGVGGVV